MEKTKSAVCSKNAQYSENIVMSTSMCTPHIYQCLKKCLIQEEIIAFSRINEALCIFRPEGGIPLFSRSPTIKRGQ